MNNDLKNFQPQLRRFFSLSWVLAKMKFKLKNEGSYLGILWYLLNPILTFLLLYFIFNDRLGQGINQYPLYLFLGVIMFNFFQQVTMEATYAIWESQGMIKTIVFPRESLVASIIIHNLQAHFLEFALFVIISVFFYGQVHPLYLLFYLALLALFAVFNFGFCLLISAISVYFTDFQNIWSFFVRLMWLGTPIFYTIAGQHRLFLLNLLNPVYYFIASARDIAVYGRLPELWLVAGMFAYALLFLIVGWLSFNRLKRRFAEMI